MQFSYALIVGAYHNVTSNIHWVSTGYPLDTIHRVACYLKFAKDHFNAPASFFEYFHIHRTSFQAAYLWWKLEPLHSAFGDCQTVWTLNAPIADLEDTVHRASIRIRQPHRQPRSPNSGSPNLCISNYSQPPQLFVPGGPLLLVTTSRERVICVTGMA